MLTLTGLHDELLNFKASGRHSYHRAIKIGPKCTVPPWLECTLRRYDYTISTVDYPNTRQQVTVTNSSTRSAQPCYSLNRFLSVSVGYRGLGLKEIMISGWISGKFLFDKVARVVKQKAFHREHLGGKTLVSAGEVTSGIR